MAGDGGIRQGEKEEEEFRARFQVLKAFEAMCLAYRGRIASIHR